MIQHIAIATAVFLLQDTAPSGSIALRAYTHVGGVTQQSGAASLDDIVRDFNAASNRALLYVGTPAADPNVLREMRHRYSAALASVQRLDHSQRADDYNRARDSVRQLDEYVERHPPGIIVPPVDNSSD